MGRYIVTGANGHIGNVVIRKLLERGHEVTALVLPNEDVSPLSGLQVKLIYGDVTDRAFVMNLIEQDAVVLHFAGIIDIGTLPKEVIEKVNLGGTKNIVDACVANQAKKLIFLSTVHIIDPQKEGDVLVEPVEFSAEKVMGDYAKTKVKATEYILDACQNRGLNATILYPSGVLGPYDYKISELGQVILDYMNHKLTAYVKGGYNFVDVRDVADAVLNAVEKGRKGEGYIVSGRVMSLKELLTTVNRKLGRKKLPPKIALWFVMMFAGLSNFYYKVRNKKPVFSKFSLLTLNSNCNFSNAKAKTELDFEPMPIEKSVYDAIDWFIENKPEIVKLSKKDCVVKTEELIG